MTLEILIKNLRFYLSEYIIVTQRKSKRFNNPLAYLCLLYSEWTKKSSFFSTIFLFKSQEEGGIYNGRLFKSTGLNEKVFKFQEERFLIL